MHFFFKTACCTNKAFLYHCSDVQVVRKSPICSKRYMKPYVTIILGMVPSIKSVNAMILLADHETGCPAICEKVRQVLTFCDGSKTTFSSYLLGGGLILLGLYRKGKVVSILQLSLLITS